MLRQLIQISHKRNRIAGDGGSNVGGANDSLNYPPVLSDAGTKELAEILAASQLHASIDLSPPKALSERVEEHEEDGWSTPPEKVECVVVEAESFLAGDEELLEEFLSGKESSRYIT